MNYKLTTRLWKDKDSFKSNNSILFHKQTIKPQQVEKENDSSQKVIEWLYKYDTIYDIMKECSDYMYLSAGRTCNWYDVINIDIDYDDWTEDFIEAVKRLLPSAILMRKSNRHLQIQFQAVKPLPHTKNNIHKSWQSALNEIIWKIAKACGLNWSFEDINCNNSTTVQNVYHKDFSRIYFEPNNKSIDWKNCDFEIIDENTVNKKYSYKFFNYKEINNYVEFACNNSISCNNTYNIDMALSQSVATTNTKAKSNKFIYGTNDESLCRQLREYVWSYMRNNNGNKPTRSIIETKAFEIASQFENSKKTDAEIKAVAKCTGNWAIKNYNNDYTKQTNEWSEFTVLHKKAKMFVRYVNAIYKNEEIPMRTLRRYKSLTDNEIAKLYESSIKYLQHATKDHTDLINDIHNAIHIYNDNNVIYDTNSSISCNNTYNIDMAHVHHEQPNKQPISTLDDREKQRITDYLNKLKKETEKYEEMMKNREIIRQ